MKVLIYRPDKAPDPRVNPALCYMPNGQNFLEYQKDLTEAYNYKVEMLKRELNKIPEHKIIEWG